MKNALFNLSNTMIALLEKHGITTPTPVQEKIIPAIIEGKDVLAQSETGSGKTLSFAIPVIERVTRRDGLTVLVLVPTRELCIQITEEFAKFSQGKQLGIVSVYGGVSIGNQIKKAGQANIVIATPGRLIDLLERRSLSLESIKYLIFDEADRMLDMGFIKDIERILRTIPKERQTMLFSATVSKEISVLSQKYLRDPVRVQLDSGVKPEFLHQTYYATTAEQKLPLLIHLLKQERDLVLVFCNRKHVTARLAKKLASQGVHAKCLNGDMSQPQRERVIGEFRSKRINVLVATDVAARGLHIEDISHVYNYEIPKDVESYTHRIGRTARAGKKGDAISLVATSDEQKFFKQILFEHRGSISLKSLGDVKLPELPQSLSSGGGREGQRKPQSRAPQRQGQQRRSEQGNHHRRNEQGSQQRRGEQGRPQRRRGRRPERTGAPKNPQSPAPPATPKVKGESSWRERWQRLFRK
jgi:superfamily II DNA/RNA helicase